MSGDLFNLSVEQLNAITHLSLEECDNVLKLVNNNEPLKLTSASLLLKRELVFESTIPTLSSDLNALMGDGFPLGRLCEIAGASGTGKTQLCFQLCVTVQLPELGLAGDALYIDVDNSFRFNRIAEIAAHLREKMEDHTGLDDERISEHIFVERCEQFLQLKILILDRLEPFLQRNDKVRLVIIDSIAYLIRYDFEGNANERNAILWQMSSKLRELAAKYNLCIVVTNHVRYQPEARAVTPALGDRWGHYCALRLFLDKKEDTGRRIATLTKSVKQQQDSIYFSIGPQGISDEEKPPNTTPTPTQLSSSQATFTSTTQ